MDGELAAPNSCGGHDLLVLQSQARVYIFQVFVFCHVALSGNGWRAASARLVRDQYLLVLQSQALPAPGHQLWKFQPQRRSRPVSFLSGLMRCVFDF